MASIVITSLTSVWSHHQHSNVPWQEVRVIAFGVSLGAVSGAVLADGLSAQTLKTIFASCVFVLSVHMILDRNTGSNRQVPSNEVLALLGIGVGLLASLMGISGGLVLIPLMHYLGMDLRRAIGCGAACGVIAAIMGSVSYLTVGLNNPHLPDFSVGYIYLPALFGIVATSSWFAPIGVRLGTKLPVRRLKQTFAMFLVIVGLNMVLF